MEALKADVNFKEVIKDIINTAAKKRPALSQLEVKRPTQREEEKLVFSEVDIKRMNYKWLDLKSILEG
jgi:hypothetical protein